MLYIAYSANISSTAELSVYVYQLAARTNYAFHVMAFNKRTSVPGVFSGVVNKVAFGSPTPPTDVTIVPYNCATASIQLCWAPPLDNGGPEQINYMVELSSGIFFFHTHLCTHINVLLNTDGFVWSMYTINASSCLSIAALTTGISYSFRVTAWNIVGYSETSANVTTLFGAVPLPPLAPVISDLTVGTFNTSVTFVLARQDNDTNTWFTIEYKSEHSNWIREDFILGSS